MKEDMSTRFKNLSNFVIPDWVINPFLSDSQQALQTELINLQNDCKAEVLFTKKDLGHFGLHKDQPILVFGNFFEYLFWLSLQNI